MYLPLILSIDVIGFEVAICRLLLLLIFLEVRVILSPSKKKLENNVFLKDTYDFICKEKRCMQNYYLPNLQKIYANKFCSISLHDEENSVIPFHLHP